MNRSDWLTMAAVALAIVLFVDFRPPLRVLDIAIVALAALWFALTVLKWLGRKHDGKHDE